MKQIAILILMFMGIMTTNIPKNPELYFGLFIFGSLWGIISHKCFEDARFDLVTQVTLNVIFLEFSFAFHAKTMNSLAFILIFTAGHLFGRYYLGELKFYHHNVSIPQ